MDKLNEVLQEWRKMRDEEMSPHVRRQKEEGFRLEFVRALEKARLQLPCLGRLRFTDQGYAGEIGEIDLIFLVRLRDSQRPYQREMAIESLPDELIEIELRPGERLN